MKPIGVEKQRQKKGEKEGGKGSVIKTIQKKEKCKKG
jgi:hypothetical protein